MGHPFVPHSECEWKGIIIWVLYVFKNEQIPCPFIPDTVDIMDINQFRDWLNKDTGDYIGCPTHNGLKLFLWILDDFYHMLEKPS